MLCVPSTGRPPRQFRSCPVRQPPVSVSPCGSGSPPPPQLEATSVPALYSKRSRSGKRRHNRCLPLSLVVPLRCTRADHSRSRHRGRRLPARPGLQRLESVCYSEAQGGRRGTPRPDLLGAWGQCAPDPNGRRPHACDGLRVARTGRNDGSILGLARTVPALTRAAESANQIALLNPGWAVFERI